jgi:hypothetical protein
MLPHIAQLAPRRLLYVSCHPGTLARDLGVLVHEHGFQLLAAGVVDMFAHTAHVESLALLRRQTLMAVEIERKFRVINDAWRDTVRTSTLLRQGYLANTARASVRVRLAGERAGCRSRP